MRACTQIHSLYYKGTQKSISPLSPPPHQSWYSHVSASLKQKRKNHSTFQSKLCKLHQFVPSIPACLFLHKTEMDFKVEITVHGA